jgi:NAD(P)-dependent dehydrogenase (short-subunit alcohol dehydrogenase family)
LDSKRRFEGRVAIVTGAASGIGLATAKRLASEGANVVIADLHEEKARSAARDLEATTSAGALGVACDVSNDQQVQAAVAAAMNRFGGLDVIVNNAGVMIFKPLEQQTEEDWLKVLRIDLMGAFFFTKQAFLHMRRGGCVVNVSSIHAMETTPLVSSYAAAKAAVVSLTRSSSIEAKSKGIRVNAVLPGAVDTPMLWNNPNIRSGLEQVNKADVGKPEDIAAAIAYLASDDAAFVDGAALRVDGGVLRSSV